MISSERLYSGRRNKIWDMQQARLLLWDSPTPLGSVLVPGFLWVPPAPGSRCLCSPEGFAPNLLIPEFIENSAQQQLVQVSRPFLP